MKLLRLYSNIKFKYKRFKYLINNELSVMHNIGNLVDKANAVKYFSTMKKKPLSSINYRGSYSSQPVNNSFGDNFNFKISKSYRFVVVNKIGLKTFGNEHHIVRISIRKGSMVNK